MVGVVNDLEFVGKLMSLEHPADEVDVHGVIFHNDDRQQGARYRRIHNRNSS